MHNIPWLLWKIQICIHLSMVIVEKLLLHVVRKENSISFDIYFILFLEKGKMWKELTKVGGIQLKEPSRSSMAGKAMEMISLLLFTHCKVFCSQGRCRNRPLSMICSRRFVEAQFGFCRAL